MSIQKIRRSVLAATLLGGLAVSGLLAGRLLARQGDLGHMHPDAAPKMFRHLAKQLDLSADQQSQIRGVLKNHADEISANVRAGTPTAVPVAVSCTTNGPAGRTASAANNTPMCSMAWMAV